MGKPNYPVNNKQKSKYIAFGGILALVLEHLLDVPAETLEECISPILALFF